MKTLLLLLALPVLVSAHDAALAMKWSETPAGLAGHRVVVTLANGKVLEGRWISVDASSFTLLIEKTTDKRAYSRGRLTLSRADVQSLGFRRHRI